jgi:hypothetical protein
LGDIQANSFNIIYTSQDLRDFDPIERYRIQHRARLWPTTSCWLRHVGGSAHPRIWYSSLADLTPRIDPYSVVIGSARRSEFQSQLACPLEGLRRITRRERHGSGYVRKASASRGVNRRRGLTPPKSMMSVA